ncbi:MAG: UDP-2,3-diacylglucosamine diphosphatase [Candidatus Jorgensenbacteria bacterium]
MPERKAVNTMVISDVHLGSEVSRPEALLATLKSHSFGRLILLGDIFDDLNFNRLSREHWELLSYIRLLTNRKRRVEVIWVVGNHDELLVDIMKYLIGSDVKEHFFWKEGGQKFFAIHGHQFDYFLIRNRFLSNFAASLYKIVQRLDTKRQRFSRYIKRASKSWLRASEAVEEGAVRRGGKMGADYVFCGHTHKALHSTLGNIEYFNAGCWTDIPSSYVTITNGIPELHRVS